MSPKEEEGWRCSNCGEKYVADNPNWRWTETVWEHRCSNFYQDGFYPAQNVRLQTHSECPICFHPLSIHDNNATYHQCRLCNAEAEILRLRAFANKDINLARKALNAIGYVTPKSGYGNNTSWVIEDLCKALNNLHQTSTLLKQGEEMKKPEPSPQLSPLDALIAKRNEVQFDAEDHGMVIANEMWEHLSIANRHLWRVSKGTIKLTPGIEVEIRDTIERAKKWLQEKINQKPVNPDKPNESA